jgi:hypothetical protein
LTLTEAPDTRIIKQGATESDVHQAVTLPETLNRQESKTTGDDIDDETYE